MRSGPLAGAATPAVNDRALGSRLNIDGSSRQHAVPREKSKPPVLTLVDDFTRECLGLIVDTSLTALRVVRELDHPHTRLNRLPQIEFATRPTNGHNQNKL